MLQMPHLPFGHWLQSPEGDVLLGRGEVPSQDRVEGALTSFSLASFSPSLKGVAAENILRGGLTRGQRGLAPVP